MSVQLLQGDALAVLATLDEASIGAVVTDPPYELGFMGKSWDRSGIANNVDLWRAVRRVCKPGAHLLAFGATRTYHRMACAIEDAGWEIRDMIAWHYGQGFPKSNNLGDGRGTALKPATEPIVLARAPLSEKTLAANVQRWGCGALNIDTCRISTPEERSRPRGTFPHSDDAWGNGHLSHTESHPAGRWPANLVLSCCGEDPHLEGCPVRDLDAQSGQTSSHDTVPWVGQRANRAGFSGLMPETAVLPGRGDTGGASRFFFVAKPSRAEKDRGIGGDRHSAADLVNRNPGSAGMQSPRAGAGRTSGGYNTHNTVKPLSLMHHLCRLVGVPGGTILDPFCGSGTTGIAALSEGFSFIGVDLSEEYLDIARQRLGLFAAVGS